MNVKFCTFILSTLSLCCSLLFPPSVYFSEIYTSFLVQVIHYFNRTVNIYFFFSYQLIITLLLCIKVRSCIQAKFFPSMIVVDKLNPKIIVYFVNSICLFYKFHRKLIYSFSYQGIFYSKGIKFRG